MCFLNRMECPWILIEIKLFSLKWHLFGTYDAAIIGIETGIELSDKF